MDFGTTSEEAKTIETASEAATTVVPTNTQHAQYQSPIHESKSSDGELSWSEDTWWIPGCHLPVH